LKVKKKKKKRNNKQLVKIARMMKKNLKDL
jgi:hypothetical protein